MHIGSQLLSLSPLRDSFLILRDLADEIARIQKEPLEMLDLGGGIGITYKNEKTPDLKKYCALIKKTFDPKTRILLEPGRSIAGNAGFLVSRVLFRKHRKQKDFLVIDAAMNDLLRPALYGSYHEIEPLTKRGGKLKKTDVVGPVCETADCLGSDRMLPEGLDAGDLVLIKSAGAYGFTMSSQYNSRPRAAEVLVLNGKPRLIRKRETYDDLIVGEELDHD